MAKQKPAKKPVDSDWIDDAIKRPGAFKRKATNAGKTTAEFAAEVLKPDSKASARTKRQANLAKTLAKMRQEKKK